VFKLFSILSLFLFLNNCSQKKDSLSKPWCVDGHPVGKLSNAKAKIIATSIPGIFYIREIGAIDTTYAPCNLPAEFYIDQLTIKVSGNIMPSLVFAGDTCCLLNFTITQISK